MMQTFNEVFLPVLGFIAAIVLFIFGLTVFFSYIEHVNNKASVVVKLDGVTVYTGSDRYVVWGQLGEVGNKYSIEIFRSGFWNKFWGKKVKCHVGENLEVSSKEEKNVNL